MESVETKKTNKKRAKQISCSTLFLTHPFVILSLVHGTFMLVVPSFFYSYVRFLNKKSTRIHTLVLFLINIE